MCQAAGHFRDEARIFRSRFSALTETHVKAAWQVWHHLLILALHATAVIATTIITSTGTSTSTSIVVLVLLLLLLLVLVILY